MSVRREKGGRRVGGEGIEREQERERESESERESVRLREGARGTESRWSERARLGGRERGRVSVKNNAALSEWLILLRVRSSVLVCPLSVCCAASCRSASRALFGRARRQVSTSRERREKGGGKGWGRGWRGRGGGGLKGGGGVGEREILGHYFTSFLLLVCLSVCSLLFFHTFTKPRMQFPTRSCTCCSCTCGSCVCCVRIAVTLTALLRLLLLRTDQRAGGC